MALLYWVFSPFSTLDSYGEKNPPAPVIIPLLNHEYARKCTDKHSDIGHRRRSDEERRGERREGGWAYLKKRAARCRTPESLQRWKPGPSRSVCQLADTGMRGLFIGSVKRQTFGGHLVWVQLSVSISPLLFFQTMLRKHGRATLGAP